jgi:hypothetical protein
MTMPHRSRESTEPSTTELARLQQLRTAIEAELPDLIANDQLRKEAREEASISGAVRDAIHRSDMPLNAIAAKAGLPLLQLDEFLTGERTLRSDVLDRLASAIGYQLPPARAGA